MKFGLNRDVIGEESRKSTGALARDNGIKLKMKHFLKAEEVVDLGFEKIG
jgi:hypothetical protein